MAQAIAESSTRRSFLRLVGAGALAASTAVAAAAAVEPDPIFAAIDAMKRATVEGSAVATIHDLLEQALPSDKRRSEINNDSVVVIDSDEPDWIALQHRTLAAWDEVDQRSIELLDIRPTTFAGVIALLRYAYKHEAEDGNEWLFGLSFEAADGEVWGSEPVLTDKLGISWSVCLHRHVAESLEAILETGEA